MYLKIDVNNVIVECFSYWRDEMFRVLIAEGTLLRYDGKTKSWRSREDRRSWHGIAPHALSISSLHCLSPTSHFNLDGTFHHSHLNSIYFFHFLFSISNYLLNSLFNFYCFLFHLILIIMKSNTLSSIIIPPF